MRIADLGDPSGSNTMTKQKSGPVAPLRSRYNSQVNLDFKSPAVERPSESWRASMLNKLSQEKIWLQPETKPRTHQTCIIFDWDDTLLPTTFLIPY